MDNVTPAAPQPQNEQHEAPKQEAPKAEAPKAEAPKAAAPHNPDMVMIVLSYLGILFLIPLLVVNPKSEVLKFHLRQGIVLFVICVVLGLLPRGMSSLTIIPGILSIIAIVKAFQGEQWELPVVGEYAKKIKV